jgi:ribonuclease HII
MKTKLQKKPTFEYESHLWDQGLHSIAGVDEVGRGCFAGPVVAAAVILTPQFPAKDRVNDSKKLSPKIREELTKIIKEYAVAFSIAEVSVSVINKIGIGKAAQQAFVNAVNGLETDPEHILIDGFMISALQKAKQTAIIHGDGISISIAAASIIAKVYRDELMQQLHPHYEVYDFFTNKGYGTKKHRDAIGKYGLCDLHRTSFDLKKFLPT